jgi:hypothetical protein
MLTADTGSTKQKPFTDDTDCHKAHLGSTCRATAANYGTGPDLPHQTACLRITDAPIWKTGVLVLVVVVLCLRVCPKYEVWPSTAKVQQCLEQGEPRQFGWWLRDLPIGATSISGTGS